MGPKCFEKDDLRALRLNRLEKEIERVENNTDFMGPSFIDTCPILGQYPVMLVEHVTGADKCSFDEFTTLGESFSDCMANASSKFHDALDLITTFISDKA